MARKKKNSDGYDGDSYDNGGSQDTLDDMLFNEDQKHYIEVEKYAKKVDQLYQQAVTDLSNLASQMQTLPQSQSFEFKHNKRIADQVTQTIQQLAARIEGVIDYGCRHEWDAACIKADKYIEQIQKSADFTREQLLRYQDRNLEALAAFQERKVEGLNLSERVWKMVSPLKDEVELAVDTSAKYFDHGVGINTKDAINKIQSAIGKGTSAAELSREVRQCLQEPNKLFRRVKDKYGNLTLSKAAKLYHPGQGVYRSSYKNAMRMTRSEINMAYRQSDSMRWQQLDFVVGIKVETSNNHTTTDPKSKGRIKLVDICDELEGKYPRDFKFVGWHPQCRCHATPILKTLDEISAEEDAMDDPNYVPKPSKNAVTDTPAGFKKYMQDNAERMKGWSSTPYYIKDNPQYFDQALHPEKYKMQEIYVSPLKKEVEDYIKGYNNPDTTKEELKELKKNMLESAYTSDEQYALEDQYKEMASTVEYTKEQRKAIRKYAAGSYDLNTALDNGDLEEGMQELIDTLDSAFKPIEKDTIVYKGWIKGEFKETAGYQSTTTNVLTAESFATRNGGIEAFIIPKGTPVIFGDELETEIILPRGFKMKRIRVDARQQTSTSLQLTADQAKALSDFQAYANNHQGSKQFASALADAQKAMLAGDQKAFDAAMTSMGAIDKDGYDEYLRRKKNRELYEQYKNNPDYSHVEFDEETGGLKVYHKDHNFDKERGHYEKEIAEAIFNSGHSIILESERNGEFGQRFVEGKIDGLKCEFMGCETATRNNYLRGLKHSASKRETEIAVLYFPNGGYNEEELMTALKRYEGLKKLNDGQYLEFKRVMCIQDGKIVYYEPLKAGTGSSELLRSTSRGANIATSSQTTNNQPDNPAQNSKNRRLLIRKRAKSPKEQRHEWDARIAELKAKADKYHLDTEAIDQAYTSLDLKRLEQAVASQEQALARRTKTYAIAEKRHQQRTKADIDTMQTNWNMRRAKAYGLDHHITEAEELVYTHGIDRNTIDTFLTSKQGKTRAQFEEKMADFNKAIEEAKNEKEINGLVRMTELSGWGHQLKAEGGAKATRLAKKVQDLNRSLMKRKDSVAYVNSKEYQQIIQDTERQLNEIKAHRAEVRQRAKEWAKKRAPQVTETKLTKTLDELKNSGIETLHVKKLDKELTDDEIIARVGGGDRTKGSCSSLALCFAGNKGGLDVLDFRDGDSRKFFAITANIRRFIREAGGLVEYDTDDNEASKRLWSTMQPGKYYYFATGRHAAIIRLRKEGKKTIREYLELQTPYKEDNKFIPLNKQKLKSRFGAEFDQSAISSSMMIDIDLLINDPGFRKMLEYINTKASKQNKGGGGYAK